MIACPAIVTPASRAEPVFTATFNVTVALPDPFGAFAIVIQFTLLVAVHAHPEELAVTATATEPPLAATVFGVSTLKRHTAASCARSTVASFTFTVP